MYRIFTNEKIILGAILANTVILFFGGFNAKSSLQEYCDAFFTIFFLIEACVKLRILGRRGYFKEAWNIFDFFILCLAIPSTIFNFTDIDINTNAFFCLRTIRAFKMFMMFRFVPNIENIFKGLKLALKASAVVCCGFFVFLLICSILSSALFCDYAPQYFGNPAISLYSTFRLFTIEGWYELPDAIAENASMTIGIFARAYFIILLFIGGIIGMSLINSIFVDTMVSDNNDEVLKKLKEIEEQIKQLK